MNKVEQRGHIRMLGTGCTKSQVFGTTVVGGSSTSVSVSSTRQHT
ncbi:hypothetical protein LINPERPRIM_LOCUS4867, partial [Linum perenne]